MQHQLGRCLRFRTSSVVECASVLAACSSHSNVAYHDASRYGQQWINKHGGAGGGQGLSRHRGCWGQFQRSYSSDILGAVTPAPSKLDAIVRLAEWQSLETPQIVQLWHEWYDKKSSEAPGSITAQQWSVMQTRMKECPFSLLPLHKKKPADASSEAESFIMFLAQAQLPQHILFTPLAEYQAHQSDAVPHMVCTFYTELVPSKDVCLARCDVMNMTHLNKDESVQLLSDTVACYTKPQLYEHVMAVNHSSDKFDLDALLRDLRSVSK